MADFGLRVHVRDHLDDGTPEETWPDVPGAKVRVIDGGMKVDDSTCADAVSDDHGVATIDAIKFQVTADNREPYVGVYVRPNLAAEVPVSLRRR